MRTFLCCRSRCRAATVTLLFFGTVLAARWSPCADALANFVRRPDDSFAWRKASQREADSNNAVRLDCTSQTWRGLAWHHQLLVVRPAKLRNPDLAFLFITGDDDVGRRFDLLNTLAERAGCIAAVINHVPNQPLYNGLKEDDLIAYTFGQFLESGDATWPLLFPMVKSAVRGMDAVQAEAQQESGQKITRFVVGGASKRGWTTWLTAAVDARVAAMAPMVIDMLNMKAQGAMGTTHVWWTERGDQRLHQAPFDRAHGRTRHGEAAELGGPLQLSHTLQAAQTAVVGHR